MLAGINQQEVDNDHDVPIEHAFPGSPVLWGAGS